MNRGPEFLGVPESRVEKFYTRKEHKKHQKPWRCRLTPLPRPGSTPSHSKAPPPLSALWVSGFSPWGLAEGIEGPRLLLNQGPSEPCYATVCDGKVALCMRRGTWHQQIASSTPASRSVCITSSCCTASFTLSIPTRAVTFSA